MPSEFEVLKQRIIELEAKNAKLEAKKAELLKRIMEENTRRDVRVEELEQKNKELETRLAIVEQASLPVEEQTYNDNPSDNKTVVVALQLVIADTPQEEIPTVDSKVMHDIKAVNRYPENSYEDVHRMSLEISEEFEKTVPSGNDQSHVTSVKPDLEVSMEQDDEQESLDKNQIIEQGLIQELCGTFDTCSPISSDDNISSTNTKSSCNGSENIISGSAQHLSYLFNTAIKSGQQEILDWYNYSLEFKSRVNAFTADGRIKDKMARSKIYKEVKKYISDHQYHVTLKTVSSGNDQIKDEMSTSKDVSLNYFLKNFELRL
ncbi:unnamed protein product [Rhizophagus irregularis]|nr:unnamed protein product [Rhizophagus irregularis]